MTAIKLFTSICFAVSWFAIAGSADARQTQNPEAEPRAMDAEAHFSGQVEDDRLDRALSAITADTSIQRERPEWEPDPAEIPEFEPRDPPHPFFRAIADFFQAIGSVLGYLLAAIVGIAILSGLYMVFGESLTLRRRQTATTAPADISVIEDLRPEEAHARALLDDADVLAASGRYAEAVHLLLFRSIDDIRDKRSGIIKRSLTAREIGELGVLPSGIRDALSPIIRIVERSFFGGHDVTKDGWREARASYEAFALGRAWV